MSTIYRSIGIMSGSSLDGLDLVYNSIEYKTDDSYSFEIEYCETIKFPKSIEEKLSNAASLPSIELFSLDVEFGIFIGNCVNIFIKKHQIQSKIDFIVSHGHTVFHYPSAGFSVQIGNGLYIHQITNIRTINQLRQKDISLGGQGTPIVPIGDLLFFPIYKYCLNLGGIMNISVKTDNSIISFDIGVCNQILNYYSQKLGKEYDKDGLFGKKGSFHKNLFDTLNEHEYFQLTYPKSLDNSFTSKFLIPIISLHQLSNEDIIHTFCHHIVFQIKKHINSSDSILITGGGAKNKFLISLFEQYHLNYELPNENIIDYKEALIMSLMGTRYFQNKYNVLKSVTGASENSINGQLFTHNINN